MAAVPALLRPGRTVAQVERDMRWLCQSLGSGNAEHLSLVLGVRRANNAALHLREDFVPWPDHRFELGDLVSILLETNADGGLFSALGRYFSLGPARETELFYWDLACRMQDHAASQSEADLSLCNMLAFWCRRDTERMDRIFRQSGLMREKWDRKQSGSTYGKITLRKAAESCQNIYTPKTESDYSIEIRQKPKEKPDFSRYTLDDTGNAARFYDIFGKSVRYCYPEKRWHYYDSRR